MTRNWIIRILSFFLPIVGLYLLGDHFAYVLFEEQKEMEVKKEDMEVLITGSSQLKRAVRSDLLSLSSANTSFAWKQHHHDLMTYEYIWERFSPPLNVVVFEVSYEHFEVPHFTRKNQGNYFAHFYPIDSVRSKYRFEDRFLYLRSVGVMVRKYTDMMLKIEEEDQYGPLLYETGSDTIANDPLYVDPRFFSRRTLNDKAYKFNSVYFMSSVQRVLDRGQQVVIVLTPKHKNYLHLMNQELVQRRDSVLNSIKRKFPEVAILDKEMDTINYSNEHFWDKNHLNPHGAELFTRSLDSLILQLVLEDDMRRK